MIFESWERFWASFLFPRGVVGVGIFFIVAGYFGIEREKVSISKIVQPHDEAYFYEHEMYECRLFCV